MLQRLITNYGEENIRIIENPLKTSGKYIRIHLIYLS